MELLVNTWHTASTTLDNAKWFPKLVGPIYTLTSSEISWLSPCVFFFLFYFRREFFFSLKIFCAIFNFQEVRITLQFSETSVFCFLLFIFKNEAPESWLEALCTWTGFANQWASTHQSGTRVLHWRTPQISMSTGLLSRVMQLLHALKPPIHALKPPFLESIQLAVIHFKIKWD